MNNHWYPSNSDDGMMFTEKWCECCGRESWNPETMKGNRCKILTQSFLTDHVDEWHRGKDGCPYCTAFISFAEQFKNKGQSYQRKEKEGQLKLY